MKEIPHITVSRPDIVVDAVSYRPALFGFIGKPQWLVSWRSVDEPTVLHRQSIGRDCSAGTGEMNGRPFSFIVRWRGDMRRCLRDRSFEDVVTPGAVMQLARVGNN